MSSIQRTMRSHKNRAGDDLHHHLNSRPWRRTRRRFVPVPATLLLLLLAALLHSIAVAPSAAVDTDGIVLLSFKYSVTGDPLGALADWNDADQTPCLWNGVTCGAPGNATTNNRVVAVSLPNSMLSGSIPSNIGTIEFLRTLDLSNNSFSGSLPPTLFTAAADLRVLDLSNNRLTGQIPETIGHSANLKLLNLSDNGLSGNLPENLTILTNLTELWLRNNYFTGGVPSRFHYVRVLDLSSNFIEGSLPPDFGGDNLNYLNLSHNNLSGKIPPEFASRIPGNATLDLSFNNLTGEIPQSAAFLDQESRSFSGNPGLCGVPTKSPCPIPSFPSALPNESDSAPTTSPPAIAVLPKTIGSSADDGRPSSGHNRTGSGLRPRTIAAIVVGDAVGIGILAVAFMYVYRLKKRRSNLEAAKKMESKLAAATKDSWSSTSSESRGFTRWSCLRKGGNEEGSSDTTASDSDDERGSSIDNNHRPGSNRQYKQGTLVTVDGGDRELELDTLLKASAYILGATGSSIMYKAVLEDGTNLAVRRIGESSLERFKDFEGQVRAIARLVHPNLVQVRGFYWGVEEKLIIYDFVANGSLANARYRKAGSSPCHLPWEARLRIAKGVARGLTYLHEKKHVHGNLKPSNILLGPDMEPKISDFGLERLVVGDTSYKAGGSARNFGSKRSTASRDSFPDTPGMGPSPSPSPSSIGGISPYHAPESLRTLKPSPKWDVYSFGVILLELLSGKVIAVDELGQANGVVVDDHSRAMRMADAAIRTDLEGKEEAVLGCFKLGFSCASPIPTKRPQIKDVLQALERIPSSSNNSSCTSTSAYYYGGHV